MFLKVSEDSSDWWALRSIWNNIARQAETIRQLDVTSTVEWADTLRKNVLLEGGLRNTLLLEHDGIRVGILPLYESSEVCHGMRYRRISPITELYSGRCGFLLVECRVDYLKAIMDYVINELRDWDVYQFTLVDGSESDVAFQELQRKGNYHFEKISTQLSPYVVFQGSWQACFDSLPKKFRWTLRNSRKKMETFGELRYVVCERDIDEEYFMNAMIEVERSSWKQSSGTSVTLNGHQEAFYREFCAQAANTGWFSGHVLELSGEPVAYIYGLLYRGIFYDLKESYKDQHRELSPGHVLKTFVFEELYRRNTRLYDFMGLCEDYKMRWTDKTYSRSTYITYNKNFRGRALRLASKISKVARNARNQNIPNILVP